jgi:serine/threonine protein kinase
MRYDNGVYYPVQIGEVMDNMYRIEHKLGWGGYSTVWLARDIQKNLRAVALKISERQVGLAECDIQRKVANSILNPNRLVIHKSAFNLPGRDGN